MDSLRKWFYKPKRDDRSLLAQFFFADEALNMVAAELDSFDGRENPERCSTLVNQLRHCQERVLNITGQIMDQLLGNERVPRGFRVKFPEDVLHENLAGQLWFGAECLAAGSSIMHREGESDAMRPLARALTHSLEKVRSQLRDHCLRCNKYGAPSPQNCTENLHESLKIFDRLFAEFELCYVSAMVPVKTPQEFEMQQLICVLFSETLQRARRIGLLTQDQVDDYDPALMFAIPRLAIVSGLLIFSNGPLSIDKSPELMSDMFRPFRTLLHKIRELLWTLDKKELYLLEKLLCTNEDIAAIRSNVDLSFNGSVPENVDGSYYPDISEFATRFYSEYSHCEDFFDDSASTVRMGDDGKETDRVITEADYLPENIEVLSPLIDGLERLYQVTRIDEENFDAPQFIIGDNSMDINYCNTPEVDAIYLDNTFQEENTNLVVEFDELGVNVNDNNKELDIDNLTALRTERRNSNKSHGSSRKSSQNDCVSGHHNEFAVRNLSNNALSIFDPLVSSNTYPSTSECNSSILETNLVSANQEVSENNHFDSSITNLLHNQVSGQIFSFSTNDVSNLVSTETDPEFNNLTNNVTYSPSRNDKGMSQASMPSTSHGYLILNAISQEPVILASLANNNPAAFEDSLMNSMNNPLLMTQSSISMRDVENEILEENISVTNANLSCLLFTNENFHNNYVTQESTQNSCPEDVPTSHSEKKLSNKKTQFLVGYESDTNEQTPGDSGICTENTSLDRSPDSEVKDIDDKTREMQPKNGEEIPPTELVNIKSFFFKYQEDTENVEKNEAGPSCRIMQQPEFIQGNKDNTAKSSDISVIDNCAVSDHANNSETPCDNNLCSYNTIVNTNQNLDITTPEIVLDSYDNRHNNNNNNRDKCDSKLSTDSSNICNENQKTLVAAPPPAEKCLGNDLTVRQCSSNPSVVIEDSSPVACDTPSSASSVPEPSCSGSNSTAVLNQRKLRKSSPKHKKRSLKSRHSVGDGKMWSPANVILRRAPKLKTPIKLNLDQYVEDSVGGSCSSQSSATSSFHSDWADDEEIALALQAREFASRHQTRAKFRSCEDLIHRLFVCIAAVADQLQTNYASDLRNILKSVFLMNQTPEVEDDKSTDDKKETSSNSDETEQQTEREQPRLNRDRNNSSIEYEVSASEVLTNGDSFDSIHSAEEVYADNISPSPSSRLSEENADENVRNDLNERRNSQHSDIDQNASEHLNSSRRNTISSIISKTKQSSHASLQESTKLVNQEDHESSQIEQPSSYDRSSSSSIDSNNSDNHNDDEANMLNNEDNSNYINEQMDCRDNHQDIINDNACIRDMGLRSQSRYERAPEWVPDIAAPDCMRCGIHFTAFRRRHHCRNCGKVFCAACSANSIPLPRFGQLKPVRVCEECFQLIAKRTCNSRHISNNTNGRQANYTHR